MTRLLPLLLVLLFLALLPAPLSADEPPAAPPPAAEEPPAEEEDPIPPLATDEAAKAALKTFKEDYKAKGYRGDEKTAMRDRAMRRLAEVQHPDVADRLFKLTRDRDADIRTLAVMYLGELRALPGYAGRYVVQVIGKQASDPVILMFAIEALDRLDYRGALATLRELMRNEDEGVRKVVILTVGDMQELRMFEDLLALAKELKIDQGWKTDGHEVRYDSGAAGDADQKMAEKIYKDRYGSARKGRSAARAMRDFRPVLLEALKRLTGEEFYGREQAEAWALEKKDELDAKKQVLEETGAAQDKAADAL